MSFESFTEILLSGSIHILMNLLNILILVSVIFLIYQDWKNSQKMVEVPKEWLHWLMIKADELDRSKPGDKFYESVHQTLADNLIEQVNEMKNVSNFKNKK